MRDGSRPGPSGASVGFDEDDDDYEGTSVFEESRFEELEGLRGLLHFPEEVALKLTDIEYQMFYQDPLQPAAASTASQAPTASAASPAPAAVSSPLEFVPIRQRAPVLIPAEQVSKPVPVAASLDPLLSDECDDTAMAGPSGSTHTTANRLGRRRRHDRRTESRRSYIQRVSAGPPQYAQDFEERRLEIDARTAQAFEGISAALGGIREILADVLNLMRSIDLRINQSQ